MAKCMVSWYGGKVRLSKQILQEFGEHSDYWEPYCGGMSMLFNKSRSRRETVNDLDGDILNLARVIQHEKAGPMFYRAARRLIFHEGIYEDAFKYICDHGEYTIKEMPDVERALSFFVYSWMGRAGSSGQRVQRSFSRDWKQKSANHQLNMMNRVKSIPEFVRRLRGVAIHQGLAVDMIKKIEDEVGTLVYLDPPYIAEGGRYKYNMTLDDHIDLARSLQRFKKARVIISYYVHPLLDNLYSGWTRKDLISHRSMDASSKVKVSSEKAPEVIYINGISLMDNQIFSDD